MDRKWVASTRHGWVDAMPSRVGCALERRRLRKQFDELARLFASYAGVLGLGEDERIVILRTIREAMVQCLADLEVAKRYWNFNRLVTNVPKTIDDFSDDWLRQHCRFVGWEIKEIMRILEIPSTIRVRGTGRVFTGEEGMLVMLRRLASLDTLHQMSATFDRHASGLSELHNAMLDLVYPYAKRALQLEVWESELPRLAKELHDEGCLIPTCCGFVDGTIFKIRRPTEGEEAAYNGWKRMHATKYQAVVLSNFMVADFDGPHPGSAADPNMLRRSNLVERLREIVDRLGTSVSLYGDAAYPLSTVLYRPYRNETTAVQARFNEDMSTFRLAVEWVFGKLEQLWPFVGDKTRRAVLLRQTGKEDVISALLTNFHTCLCGGVTTDYFGIAPPTLQEYERLVLAHVRGTTCTGVRPADFFIQMLTFSLQPYKKTWPRVCNHPQDTHNWITKLDKSIDIHVLTSCTSSCFSNG